MDANSKFTNQGTKEKSELRSAWAASTWVKDRMRKQASIMRNRSISPGNSEKCLDFSHSGLIHRKRSRKIPPAQHHFPPLPTPVPHPSPGSARPMNPLPDFKVPWRQPKP